MRMRIIGLALTLAGLGGLTGGCLLDPPESEGPLSVEVAPRQGAPAADGVGVADVIVRANEAATAFRSEVEIRVSDGSLGASGQRDFRGRLPADGIVQVPLTYGRTPGPVVVEARIEGQATVDDSLVLAVSLPERIELALDAASISAFGGRAELTVALAKIDPLAQPSWGTPISTRACCLDDDDAPGPCPEGAASLNVPAHARLTQGSDAIRLSLTAAPGEAPEPGDPPVQPTATRAAVLVALGPEQPACRAADGVAVAAIDIDP